VISARFTYDGGHSSNRYVLFEKNMKRLGDPRGDGGGGGQANVMSMF
jgi:hypothetical protein